ncbi:hypothetical protein LTR66_010536 [Elasticomyces elasticus]|nr:hypothetical protein LTR66_010536 [Elasticomyces elasticus]KAK4988196.1 hypothetical protein LTR50_004119 [Elasticomyces elasticus]
MSSTAIVSHQHADARAAVTATLNSAGSSLDTELRSRAANLHSNAAAILEQEAEIAKQTKELGKQNAQWQKLADTSTKKLNEVGDLQNWAETIEREFLVLEETLRLAEGREDIGSASGAYGLL